MWQLKEVIWRCSIGEGEQMPMELRYLFLGCKRGHLEVLKWARENGCQWNEWTCTNAAEGGHLDVLKWARENGCPWSEEADDDAMRIWWYSDNYGNYDFTKNPVNNDC